MTADEEKARLQAIIRTDHGESPSSLVHGWAIESTSDNDWCILQHDYSRHWAVVGPDFCQTFEPGRWVGLKNGNYEGRRAAWATFNEHARFRRTGWTP